MQPSDAERNWNELTRRMEALPSLPGIEGSSIVVRAVPADDPTGLIELMETMNREHRDEGLRLANEFPFFESFYAPVILGRPGWREAYEAVDRLIELGAEHLKGLRSGVDYETFSDAGGEVTAFHFKSAEALGAFREHLGLDREGGFQKFAKEFRVPPPQGDSA
jgi:hypothetical protein